MSVAKLSFRTENFTYTRDVNLLSNEEIVDYVVETFLLSQLDSNLDLNFKNIFESYRHISDHLHLRLIDFEENDIDGYLPVVRRHNIISDKLTNSFTLDTVLKFTNEITKGNSRYVEKT